MNVTLVTAIASFLLVLCFAVYVFSLSLADHEGIRRLKKYFLARNKTNPVISPLRHREWETEGTFNPGAVKDRRGWVHLFYRALGRDGISRIGHTSGPDGRSFPERSPYPVYEPFPGYGKPEATDMNGPHGYDASAHASGGGWGGSEDPRTVIIGDRMYMTYTAFEGWDNMRIAVTSISLDDLEHERWNWRKPRLISPVNSRAKNWVFFPEKINGKYAILHSLSPLSIAYVDSPDMTPKIESVRDHGGWGYEDKSRAKYWDKRVRGAGAPPIKTDIGWLLLYHAVDSRDPTHVVGYKVGAMILDLKDPTKILYRSPEPILAPDMSYENDGKPGVVYASGAVVKDGKLIVYYGGGDKHTCVAETQMGSLLAWLTEYGKV
ncbi:MAG: hypothetical protein JWO00_32 [Candidatus Parcubacteria bacterium]|nr:hypothetical protein [Candidatus Parcubacteria bacterium]